MLGSISAVQQLTGLNIFRRIQILRHSVRLRRTPKMAEPVLGRRDDWCQKIDIRLAVGHQNCDRARLIVPKFNHLPRYWIAKRGRR
jgi:hypothetical protein